ncbi:MAG: zinc finger domain-containing protein [Halobacteriota archaeon]
MLADKQATRENIIMEETCISCGARLAKGSSVTYPCPICGSTIRRCKKCKKLSNPYRCSCGFGGP